ncbi:AraC family transcriptional regulator [Malaciobacter mytili]|uniref:AraC family transcriptional regulator n=2 Tax=Malaciobacter mytili TaxID=603050 RepID=UPI003A83AB5E
MKKDTIVRHRKIANDIMHYIYKYINTNIDLEELSINLKISKYHMHRIFKEEFGQNIYETIKSIRLQKAASLLLTNHNSTITNIAKMCGYSSQGAFIKVFKDKFNMTPKEWKRGDYKQLIKIKASYSLKAQILKIKSKKIYYIRHKGDINSKKLAWERLNTWVLSKDIKEYNQITLYHDNPSITPLLECQYTAAIQTQEIIEENTLPSLMSPSGIYAKFDFQGSYKEFLEFINWVYFDWLINSGYETTTEPSYVVYKKNSFLDDEDFFIASYYISIYM